MDVEVLKPSSKKWMLVLSFFLLMLVVGIVQIQEENNTGYIIVFLTAPLALGALVAMLPGASLLQLSAEGFKIKSLYRTQHYTWNNVSEFGINTQGLVGFNFLDKKPKGAELAKELTGFEAALPDTYGYKADMLAKKMNSYRTKYIS
jgi:uncharacterized integral membrane protein